MLEHNGIERKVLIASILIISIFSLLLIRQPLFNYLGYEFTASVAILIPWLYGYLTIKVFRRRFVANGLVNLSDFRSVFRNSIIWGIYLLVIPWVIATLNLFFIKNCGYWEGVLYYILIPLVTAVWAVMLATFCVVTFKRAFLAYYSLVILVFLYPLYLGYATPQIFSYNFVYGYFPGFTYDETLSITPTLILFRIITLFTALFFYFVADLIFRKSQNLGENVRNIISIFVPLRFNRSSVIFLSSSLILVILWLNRFTLGFESSSSTIQQALGKNIATEHFNIYYSNQSFSEEEIKWVAAMHEFRLHQIEAVLNVNYSSSIHSYIYPEVDTKQSLIGAGMTNIAKPWRNEIHLNKDSWQSTLKHELTHVVAGEFGIPIIKAHYNFGLTEGLATAVDEDFGNRTLHEYAASMIKFGIVNDLKKLINPAGFATSSSSQSYVLMGSFCQYLIDHYEVVSFQLLYAGKSPEDAYGKTYDELFEEWKSYILKFDVSTDLRSHIEFYFKRPSIFAKECARVIANLNKKGSRFLSEGNAISAMRIFQQVLEASWNTESFAGLVRSAYSAARYDTVIDLMDRQLGDSSRRASALHLLLMYGNSRWYYGDLNGARNVFEEILSLDLSERLNESAALRLHAINDSSLQSVLVNFFIGSMDDSTALALLSELRQRNTDPLLPYLTAKVLFQKKNYEGAIVAASLQKSFERPMLEARKLNLIAESYFYVKDYQQARNYFLQSLKYLTNTASINRVEDWIEACEWYEGNESKYRGSQ